MLNSLRSIKFLLNSILTVSAVGFVASCGTQNSPDTNGSETQAKSRGFSNLLILMYHDVIPNTPPAGYRAAPDDVTFGNFVAQLNWLQNNGYQSISLKEFSDSIKTGNAISGKKVLLTFDDNYYGTWKNGLPELAKRNMKATIFAHTQYVRPNNQPVNYAGQRPKASWNEIIEGETKLGNGELFRWESHTVSHSNLTTLTPAQITSEMINSKARIEQEFTAKLGAGNYTSVVKGTNKFVTSAGNKKVVGIAYPLGALDSRVAPIARQAGYEIGFEVGFDETFGQPNFAVPRMGVGLRLTNTAQFAAAVANYIANRR